jgi:hypothetical protein
MNLLLIILAVGLGFTAYSIVEKTVLNNAAVGRKVLLTYGDPSDGTRSELQWKGTIQRKVRIGNTFDNFVITLNEPIIHNQSAFSEVVVRERLLGKYIGSNKATEVHLLLPKQKMTEDKFKWDAFEQSAWLIMYLQ